MPKVKVAVVGAGLAGLPAAYHLRRALGDEAEVIMLNPGADFQFVPSNPWLAVGWRTPDQTSLPLRPTLARHGIRFIQDAATRVWPAKHQIETAGSRTLDYDYCVLATGPELAFDEIPGLGPDGGHTQSICTSDHALRCLQAFRQFAAAPGPIVVGAVQGASCFGPAYEFAMILDYELRQRGVRDRAPITFVTSEPYVGHLGLGGIGDSRTLLENALRSRDIRVITNACVDEVSDTAVTVTEHDAQGKALATTQLPMQFSMFIPAFRGIAAVAADKDLSNPKGFVVVDEFQRNPSHHEIYAAGVCVAIAPVEKTPVPVGVPKTGYMIESMVAAISENIRLATAGRPPSARPTWNALCLADMGDTGAAFLAMPQNPPRTFTWVKEGRWVRVSKVMLEKYFLRKMRLGRPDPAYERFSMRVLGVPRLK